MRSLSTLVNFFYRVPASASLLVESLKQTQPDHDQVLKEMPIGVNPLVDGAPR